MLALAVLLLAAAPPVLTDEGKAAISEAVGKNLADPFSAQYEWPAPRSDTVYCGWVNAKNAYGAYVGYQPYMVLYSISRRTGKLALFGKAEMSPAIVTKMCLDAGYSLTR